MKKDNVSKKDKKEEEKYEKPRLMKYKTLKAFSSVTTASQIAPG